MKKHKTIIISIIGLLIILILIVSILVYISNSKLENINVNLASARLSLVNNFNDAEETSEIDIYPQLHTSVINNDKIMAQNDNAIKVYHKSNESEWLLTYYNFLTFSDYDISSLYKIFASKISKIDITKNILQDTKFNQDETKELLKIIHFIDEQYDDYTGSNMTCNNNVEHGLITSVSCHNDSKEVLNIAFSKMNELTLDEKISQLIASDSTLNYDKIFFDSYHTTINSDLGEMSESVTIDSDLNLGNSIYTNSTNSYLEYYLNDKMVYYQKQNDQYVLFDKGTQEFKIINIYYNFNRIFHTFSSETINSYHKELTNDQAEVFIKDINMVLTNPITSVPKLTCDFTVSGNTLSGVSCTTDNNKKLEVNFGSFNESVNDINNAVKKISS